VVGALSGLTVDELAFDMVVGGRVVPGLTVDDSGMARSWWWPLPGGRDRAAIAALLEDGSVEAQQDLASELAQTVDLVARDVLCAAEVGLLARRPGRRSVPEAWVRSLTTEDPHLSTSLAPDRLRGLAREIEEWVRSGAGLVGSVQLCLRVVEPPEETGHDDGEAPDEWLVEPLVRDPDDSALQLPIAHLFDGSGLFPREALQDGLAALGYAVRVAPELGRLVAGSVPGPISFDSQELVELVARRHATLAEGGVALLLPAWWTGGPRLGLKARAASSSTSSGASAASGFGLETLVDFTWQAALGGVELTADELEMLQKAAEAKQGLVRIRGQWVEVGRAQLAAVLARVGRRGQATAAEVLRAGLGLGGLGLDEDVDDVEVVGVDADGWIGDLLDDAATGRVEAVESPPGFEGDLRPYQQRGVGWLQFLGRLGLGACLADDMGLGKTAQLIGSLLVDEEGGPTLVVCPVSVLGNWQRELARFGPGLTVAAHHGGGRARSPGDFVDEAEAHDVVLTTYSLVHRDRDLLGEVAWGRVVLDEAQQIKNPGTKAARAIRGLAASRRVALTGTPVENHLVELWSIMQFLNPGLLGNVTSFRERFARPIESQRDPEAIERLGRLTAPFVLRRLKTDTSIIDDLPPKIETVARCPLTREQVSLYQSVVDDLLARAEDSEGIERRGLVLAGITKLKQVCNHPAHFLGDGSKLIGRSGKLDRVDELVEEMVGAGDKSLIFTQFTAWGDRLAEHLRHRFGLECLWLHGGVQRKDRDAMVARFSESDGPPIMLLSLKAGGTGLNLTAATQVVHYDRWWNPAVEDQATDRAYRIGQTRTVQVHKMVSAGTIEERIDQLIAAKRDLAETVVGAGEQWLTELDTAELAAVVSLSAETLAGDAG